MTARDYRSVAARIRQELPELDRVAQRASRAWASASRDSEDLYVDAAALNIHGFYAGLERIFALIADRVDGSLPSGPNWHQDLLRQMAAEMPGTRPAARTVTHGTPRKVVSSCMPPDAQGWGASSMIGSADGIATLAAQPAIGNVVGGDPIVYRLRPAEIVIVAVAH